MFSNLGFLRLIPVLLMVIALLFFRRQGVPMFSMEGKLLNPVGQTLYYVALALMIVLVVYESFYSLVF